MIEAATGSGFHRRSTFQLFIVTLLASAAGLVPAAANQETLYAALFSCQSSVWMSFWYLMRPK